MILPAFNSAAWLHAALASIAAQTQPPLEVVIVDDASQDSTKLKAIYRENYINAMVMFSRTDYDAAGGFSDLRRSEDWDLWCACFGLAFAPQSRNTRRR